MSKHILYSLLLLLLVSSCTIRKLPPEEPEASLQDNNNAYRLVAFINDPSDTADQPVSITVLIAKESGEGSEESAPCRLATWKLSDGLGGRLRSPNGDAVHIVSIKNDCVENETSFSRSCLYGSEQLSLERGYYDCCTANNATRRRKGHARGRAEQSFSDCPDYASIQ